MTNPYCPQFSLEEKRHMALDDAAVMLESHSSADPHETLVNAADRHGIPKCIQQARFVEWALDQLGLVSGEKLKTRRDYRTKPRFEGDTGTVVRVTKMEKWRGGWWAHVRFPGDSTATMMMHSADLEPCAS